MLTPPNLFLEAGVPRLGWWGSIHTGTAEGALSGPTDHLCFRRGRLGAQAWPQMRGDESCVLWACHSTSGDCLLYMQLESLPHCAAARTRGDGMCLASEQAESHSHGTNKSMCRMTEGSATCTEHRGCRAGRPPPPPSWGGFVLCASQGGDRRPAIPNPSVAFLMLRQGLML